MLVNNELDYYTYGGLNPAFAKRVWAKRREAEREQRAMAVREAERERQRLLKKQADEAAARIAKLEDERRARLEKAVAAQQILGADIGRAIAATHGYLWTDILGPSRNRALVKVRQECIRAVADARTDLSLPQLGRIFNRDHTTILHALRKTRKPGSVR